MDSTTPPPPQQPVSTPLPSGAKIPQQSIWSLVFGILSFCLWIIGSIPAIILGVIGIKKANDDPQNVGGKGLAITGIVLGSIGILVGLVVGVMAAAALPAYQGIQDRAVQVKDISQIRMLMLGCRSYAADYDGDFPASLSDLYPDYVDDESLFYASVGSGSKGPRYLYRAGFNDSSSSYEPVILSPVDSKRGAAVGFVGGMVKPVRGEELEAIKVKFE